MKLSSLFKVLNKDLKLIFISNLMGSFGDGLYAYILPHYMRETLHANPVEVGILYAAVNIVAALTLLLAGMIADKYDRKKIMIAGWIAWLPAPIIFSIATNWLQMLPGMILWGFWLGGPTSTAYIVTSADKKNLTLTFTLISSAWSVGYTFSPALGGYLAEIIGMKIVFYLAFTFYASAALTLVFINSQHAIGYEKDVKEHGYSFLKLLRDRKLLLLSFFFTLIMFVTMLFRQFIPQFLGEVYKYNDFEIGVLGSVSFFGSAVLGIFLGKIGDQLGKNYALAVSMILGCFSLTVLLLCKSFPILILTFFLIGSTYLNWSLMGAILGPLAPESVRARWISIPQTLSMFGSFIAPYIGGVLYTLSPSYPFIVAVFAFLVFSALSYQSFSTKNKEQEI
ncbi:MFS transporter [Candidatus Bathyarchaeota archaeon]|nr:MFS transporter [Candidatus Bathyarchaeota archaeon]